MKHTAVFLFSLSWCISAITTTTGIDVKHSTDPVWTHRCDKVSWTDTRGYERSVWLVQHDGYVYDSKKNGGFIARLDWSDGEKTYRCYKGTIDALGGLGGTVNHGSHGRGWMTSQQDGSNTGSGFIFTGRHHAIWEFTADIHQSADHSKSGPAVTTTVQYLFTDGYDHFQYVITYDCSAHSLSQFNEDSRSPYGKFDWDSDDDEKNEISGIRSGTTHLFECDFSTYDFSQPYNKVPFVSSWNTRPGFDVEIGYVASRLQTKHKAGAGGNARGSNGPASSLGWNSLDFQFNVFQGFKGNRITWGTPKNSIDGENQVGTTKGYEHYSLAILVGKKSDGGVDRCIADANVIMDSATALSVTGGTRVDRGLESVRMTQKVDYDKPGFDQVYRVWRCKPHGAQMQLTFSLPGRDSLRRPTIRIDTSVLAPEKIAIALNGISLSAQHDFYLSDNTVSKTIWLTLLRNVGAGDVVTVRFGGGSGTIMQSHGHNNRGREKCRYALYDLQGRNLKRSHVSWKISGAALQITTFGLGKHNPLFFTEMK
jgi:hypothetical protein